MKLIEHLNKLHISGDLSPLIWSDGLKGGFLRKREIYLFFNKEMLINETDQPTAIQFTMDALNCSKSQVYKAIDLMEQEIPDPSNIDITA